MAAQDDANYGKPTQYLGAAANATVVTPSNDTDLTKVTRGLLIGTAGTLKVTMLGGQTVEMTAVPAGFYPWRVTRVFATGTDADDIVAFW